MRDFWFNGRCSREFGIIATGSGTYNAPKRDLTFQAIPGRNGDLILDNQRFKNITVTYPVFIHQGFARNAEMARAWLLGAQGYCPLWDGYNPDTFRLAVFAGPVDFDVKLMNRIGEAKLAFVCKPQRFLRSGTAPKTFSAPEYLYNPTDFPARPVITVRGSGAGVLTVGGKTVEILALEDEITIDCEQMEAHRQGESRNSDIYAPEFPELLPGRNEIAWDGGISSVEIVPRWWTL